MATMTIRNLDEQLKARLRIRAAQHGRSMEDEARDILRTALSEEEASGASLVDAIQARVRAIGVGFDLELPPREAIRDPEDLSS
ncbi:MAG TPA: plasmid stabilization protein [Advenella sp.]|nr:plasmid stabilization protein [Advenella sp.]